MDALLSALADPVRWRLVGLLADQPRSVGVLAQLAEARQPQTTKHLQTLERAGVVTSQRTGQRRIYALESAPLRELATALGRLAEAADRDGGPRAAFDRYGAELRAERLAAATAGWADGRSFRFRRSLAGDPESVWRHLTEAPLLARWWTPDDLRVSELVFEARPGGRIVQEYRDAEDAGDADLVAGRAEGTVEEALPRERLAYRLSPLLPDGGTAFTAHVELAFRPSGPGTDLDVRYEVTDSTVDSADFIAGIEIGFGQSLDKLVATVDAARHQPDAAHDASAIDASASAATGTDTADTGTTDTTNDDTADTGTTDTTNDGTTDTTTDTRSRK
ncbi:metalloregulator ArsR/SmtB family transcription factor [Streptomyces sp. KL116D]|uniref:metalloregulator ArsR/SmtB family transcription factor n=1 Tax=Streptomyces sp. KL116D TaxID=3045152 RepID=UPI00355670B8